DSARRSTRAVPSEIKEVFEVPSIASRKGIDNEIGFFLSTHFGSTRDDLPSSAETVNPPCAVTYNVLRGDPAKLRSRCNATANSD
uniref:Uncharacterized protein n=1 Tax=Anopheles dirus TaxID=7168 RepID=A0A182NVZ4_9DIPT